MIDLRQLADPAYRAGAERKGASPDLIDELLALDADRRSQTKVVEDLRMQANAASKDIGRASEDERLAKIEAASALKVELTAKERELETVATRADALALQVPNPAHESVPDGGEEDFELIEEVGERSTPPALDHAEFGQRMGWVQSEKAAEVSGSRFAYITGAAVQIEFALVQWALQKLVARGFIPVVPPVLVREQMMIDSGFFPTDRHQVYEVTEDELFLVGTAEVPLAGYHRGDRLDETALPLRYCGFSSCFRREAGTYGKDTRGIFRVHQFDKLEMFIWSTPDQSWAEHEMLLAIERELLDELGLPYRVINVAAGDLGAPAAKKYDCEVWLPSEGRYREISSCSNYLDYSGRRLGTRVKGEDGTMPVHTLNGTAVAIARMLVFLMEHCQGANGQFVVPEVLRPFCGLTEVPMPSA